MKAEKLAILRKTGGQDVEDLIEMIDKRERVLNSFVDLYEHDSESWLDKCSHSQPIRVAVYNMPDVYREAVEILNGETDEV